MTRQPLLPDASPRTGMLPKVWLARGQTWWRAMAAPTSQTPWALSGSATLNAQVWISQFPLRPTAGWVVIAAFLATGWPLQPTAVVWRDLALILLLADPLWGSVWRLAAGRGEMLQLHARDTASGVWLPYLQPGSPADRLLGHDEQGVLHLLARVVLPTVALPLAIAWVLGTSALFLTAVVIVAGVMGWIVRHSVGTIPALLHSLVTVALPWLLGLLLFDAVDSAGAWSLHLALIAIWTLHNWGEGRYLRVPGDRAGVALLALADLAIVALLIAGRAPLPLALLAVIWLPVWLTVLQRRAVPQLNVMWLLALLITAVAIGQVG